MKSSQISAITFFFLAMFFQMNNVVNANQSNQFRIGTGGSGGTYYPVGTILATAITQVADPSCSKRIGCGVKDLNSSAIVTKASKQNVTDVHAGDMESGLSDAATLHFAFKGVRQFENAKKSNLRVIANLFPEDLHLVLPKDAELNGLADLKGRRVGIAQAGSGTQNSVEQILADYGIDRSNIEEYETGQTESAKLMAAGKLDAYFYAAGTPVSTIADLNDKHGVKLYSFSDEEVRQANKTVPYYIPSVIKAGTYKGIDYDVKTVAVSALWVTNANQPDELIYDIVKSIWSERSRSLFINGHRKAQDINLYSALNGLDGIGVPLHPGAEKFYKRACMFTIKRSDENILPRFPIQCGR